MAENRIKVVHIIADGDLGGGPSHVLGLLKALDQKKFEPFLIAPGGHLADQARKIGGIQIFHSPMKSKFDLISFFEIRTIIRQIKVSHHPFDPIIIHSHGTRAGLLGRLFRIRNTVSVYTEHRWDEDYHLSSPINEFLQLKMLRRLNRKTTKIIAVSSSVKKFLLEKKLAVKGQLELIPNAIDLAQIKSNKAIKKIENQHKNPIIGTIGSLNVMKGQTYLLPAMREVLKKYPGATLEVIGEGPERPVLEARIHSLGLDHHVSLLGRKNDIERHLRHWDVFVLPSVAETFGITLLEAMSAGIPIVATKVGGIPDVVENKKSGLLVERRDSEKLAGAILEILDHPVLAAKLKRGGLERVEEFDWNKVIKKIEKVYLDLIEHCYDGTA